MPRPGSGTIRRLLEYVRSCWRKCVTIVVGNETLLLTIWEPDLLSRLS